MAYGTIQFAVTDGVAVLTLNRPDKFNAFTIEMHREMADALKKVERDRNVRCLVLTGAGKAFCAGQDLTEMDTDRVAELIEQYYNPLLLRLRALERPVLAAVNGVAAGAGMSLALAADLRVASDRASFATAFVKAGLVPDTGVTYMLPRLVGFARAMELCLLGDRIDAETARQYGLVNQVAPADEFEAAWRSLAQRLAAGPLAMGYTKRMLNRSLEASLEDQLAYEVWHQVLAVRSHDGQEGVAAFRAKRQPQFQGN